MGQLLVRANKHPEPIRSKLHARRSTSLLPLAVRYRLPENASGVPNDLDRTNVLCEKSAERWQGTCGFPENQRWQSIRRRRITVRPELSRNAFQRSAVGALAAESVGVARELTVHQYRQNTFDDVDLETDSNE